MGEGKAREAEAGKEHHLMWSAQAYSYAIYVLLLHQYLLAVDCKPSSSKVAVVRGGSTGDVLLDIHVAAKDAFL